MKKLYIACLISIFACLVGCQPDTQEKEVSNIDPQVKAIADSLNQMIVKALFNNDPVPIESVMSTPLLEQSGTDIDVFAYQISNIISSAQFQVFDEYHLTQQLNAPMSQTYSGGTADDAFSIKFKTITDEVYISLLQLDEAYPDHILMLLYGLFEEGWRLNILQFGQYAYLGKNAPTLWREAQDKEAKQHFVDAANLLALSQQCLKPAAKFWEYREEAKMTQAYERIMQQINNTYQFPIMVEAGSYQPSIFGIYPQITEEGIYPMIEYTTQNALIDSVQLQAENDLLHQQIGTLFPGLDQEKSHLLYRAYDSIPDGKRQPNFYGFIQELSTSP